ncbi:MAG: hypothetical protein HY701_14015 [Gemmatimonadetes bacterium]|nr:hypothetical protein [Gemmatimonadota bacterium]
MTGSVRAAVVLHRPARLSFLAFVVISLGCAGAESAQTARVVSADAALRAAVLDLLPDVERLSGLRARRPLRVERRDRAQLERYLRAQLDSELPPALADRIREAYAFLGLLPDDLDLRALLLQVYTEQVAGFYEPDSTALFVMAGNPPGGLESILAHELVHALQDQHTNLDSLTARARGNDQRVAAHAVIEGHATLVMFESMLAAATGGAVDISELPDLSQHLGPTLEAMQGQFPALQRAPLILRQSLLFPYLGGAGYVQALWRQNAGRPSPFGRYFPESSEQVLDPERALGARRDSPTELVITLPVGAQAIHSDNLGQLEVSVLLQEHVGPSAADLARGWDGDRFVVLQRQGRDRAFVWYSVWDDASARDRLIRALRGPVQTRLRAELIPVDIAGRPGARLSVGDVSGVGVRIAGAR